MREHEGNGNAIVGNWWFLPFLLKGMRRTGWLRHPHQFKVQLMHGEVMYIRPGYALLLALTRSRISGANISSIANPIFPPGTTMLFGRDMNELWIISRR